ncbi:hypothetical protein P7K49_002817, partial [Saguinus oedipus]
VACPGPLVGTAIPHSYSPSLSAEPPEWLIRQAVGVVATAAVRQAEHTGQPREAVAQLAQLQGTSLVAEGGWCRPWAHPNPALPLCRHLQPLEPQALSKQLSWYQGDTSLQT